MVKPASLPARPRRPPPLAPTSSSSSSSSSSDGRFKGVRMRSWGRWVSEIRIPHSRDKIWLGSYGTAQQAARAYDVASLLLRGPSCAAFLNFSDSTVLMMDRLAPLANGVASPRTIQVTAAAVANAETGAATEFQPCNRMPADDDDAKQSLNSEIITEESSQWRKDQQGESADTLESMSCWIQDVISLLSPKDKTSPPATSIPCFNGNSPSNALQSARATSLEPFNTMFDEFHPFESLAWEGFTVMSPAVTTRERFDTDTGCGEVDGSLWS